MSNEHREQAREIVYADINIARGQAAERLIDRIASALSSRDAEARFMVHEPTHVVECNDSRCPVGATIIGWPHGLDTPGCMYYPTVVSRDAEIREVLEGLACWPYENIPCWCSHSPGHDSKDPICAAAHALYAKLQPKESSDVTESDS